MSAFPPPPDGLAAVVHALKWTARHGDRDIAQACAVVMRENYSDRRREAWQQLTLQEQQQLRQLMAPDQPQQLEIKAA
ncbi:MAG: hypothetical protein WBA10_07710 [Elainellaceae cyanobacterium]